MKCTLLINTLINTSGFYANISHDSHSAVQLDSLACIPVVSAPLSLEKATSVNCTLQAWLTRYNRQVYHTTRTRLLHHEQLVSSCPYNIAACITLCWIHCIHVYTNVLVLDLNLQQLVIPLWCYPGNFCSVLIRVSQLKLVILFVN